MNTFKLPELGEGLSEGEVVAWKVKEGDFIAADKPMVEVMTDKATVEVPAPKSGIVKKLYYKAGEMAKVGAPLIDIEVEGASAAASSSNVQQSSAPAAQASAAATGNIANLNSSRTQKVTQTVASASAAPALAPTATTGAGFAAPSRNAGERVLASPAVRKLAREMNVDLERVKGTGDRGRVLRADLEVGSQTASTLAPASSSASGSALRAIPAGTLEERIPFIGIRRKIADRLSESANTAVHFTHFDECDFSEIIRLREEANVFAEKNGLGVKLTYLPFFVKASIAALRKFPILNSTLDTQTNEVVIKHYYHFGISVQTDNGLMVGVVRDCDKKDIFQIAKEIKEVADRARSGKASLQDLSGSTITITNPGNIGGLYATPVINYPETVILGMYQIKRRPIAKLVEGEEQIVIRPMMYTNITCDHRIIDGAIAAGYLRLFCDYIENPGRMMFY